MRSSVGLVQQDCPVRGDQDVDTGATGSSSPSKPREPEPRLSWPIALGLPGHGGSGQM